MGATEAVAEAVKKLSEVAEMLLKPRATRALGEAQAESIMTVAQAEIVAADLKVQASQRRELDDVRHLTNLAAALQDAKTQIAFIGAKKLLPEKASEGESDPDWFYKWAGYAKETSDEDIRSLWAKVLAGELIQPGKFSLRLLHAISLLRKSEAQSFSLLANYVSTDGEERVFVLDSHWSGESLLRKFGLDGNLFRRLENLGLVQRMKDARGIPIYLQRGIVHYGGHSYGLILLHVPNPMTPLFVSVDVRELTELGEELYELCNVQPDKEYAEEFFKRMLGHEGSGWTVTIDS